MIFLIGSIILTSYLVLSFKLVDRLKLNILQVIVFNYITCVITGSIFNGKFPLGNSVINSPWIIWALVMGAFFILLFNVVGLTTKYMGVAVASVAYKLSLIIPFLFSVFFYSEPVTGLKITGIVLALVAVFLTCWKPSSGENQPKKSLATALLPLILFVGSGLLDTMIKYVEATFLNESNKNDYLVTAFSVAALIGIVWVGVQFATGKQRFSWKALALGISIGIPNYFSIWFLVRALKEYSESSSVVIPVNNMGIVLFSTVIAWIVFKEKLSAMNWSGVFLSLVAIALIAYG
ncbi:MAG: DMT family transporter [Chitinophagaceae bacterium]|nr:DMT family transporter [Chitinophagaceae bacterium]